MVTLSARQGRQLQRYSSTGGRLVVGFVRGMFLPSSSSVTIFLLIFLPLISVGFSDAPFSG